MVAMSDVRLVTHMCVAKELVDSYCETVSRITETATNIRLACCVSL